MYAIITLHEVKDTCAAKYCCHMLQLHEQIKVLVYTNVTSVLYTFVNNRQNNVIHWTFIYLHASLEPVHEFLVLNALALSRSLNMHGQLPSVA